MSTRILIAAALVVLSLAGCAPLRPWERGLLVSEAMKDPGDSAGDAFDTHYRTIRETAAGAGGTGGVSCGCN